MSMMVSTVRIKTLMLTATCGLTLSLTACNKPTDTTKSASDDKASSASATTNTVNNNATGKKIRIATEGGYPPFNYSNADGSLGGFDVDVAKALCAEMKADCKIVAQDWDGILPGLMAKKYDAVIAGMSITPERQQQVDFTTPYFKNTMVWLAPKQGKFNLQNISGLKLGSQRSTTPGTYLQEHYGKTNDVKLYDKYDNAYLDLKSTRVDAVLSEKVPGVEWLKKNGDKFGFVGGEIDNNDNIAMAVRKGDALKGEFDTAMATIKANGTLAKLEKQYFGDNAETMNNTTANAASTTTATTASAAAVSSNP